MLTPVDHIGVIWVNNSSIPVLFIVSDILASQLSKIYDLSEAVLFNAIFSISNISLQNKLNWNGLNSDMCRKDE